jgi:hypothetical protein
VVGSGGSWKQSEFPLFRWGGKNLVTPHHQYSMRGRGVGGPWAMCGWSELVSFAIEKKAPRKKRSSDNAYKF